MGWYCIIPYTERGLAWSDAGVVVELTLSKETASVGVKAAVVFVTGRRLAPKTTA